MGEIHLPGDERFDTGLLSTQKRTRLIEPRYNDDMNDKSGDRTEKSNKENGVILNRNTTAKKKTTKKNQKQRHQTIKQKKARD